ncbi:zinc finger protein 469 [Cebus imitator]|uniref:zinc finger protein 469 n=1 Tax=Cebus imitator TaxID=2715852 RepID=UPI00189AD292|nr:zinc finger protein 469 [Cebus imitator]
MPGERPRGAPAPTMTGDLQPCHVASSLGRPSQAPLEDHSPASRTTKGVREVGGRAQAMELPEAQPRQARDGEPQPPPLRGQALSSTPTKGGGPQTPPGRSPLQAPSRPVGKADGSPPKHYSLSIAGSKAKATLDQMPENPPLEAAQPPEVEALQGPGTGAPLRPGLSRTEAQPTAEELGFHSCFQETRSSFTSINYTSPSATPRPPATGPPQSRGTSPLQPSPYPELQASGADSWPPAAENSFPGANFGAPPAESEPIPTGSRPGGSPVGASFQFPFPALRGAGAKPFPANMAGHAFTDGPLVFAFHQPRGAWPEEAMGAGPAYPLPTQSAPSPLPCYQGQPGGVNPHSNLSGALSPPGAAHLAPRPFSDTLHKSLTKILPERPRPAQEGLGSPREPPSSLPQRHFPGQAYGASRVDTSPGPLDTELATPGPTPPRLPQLWDPTAAPYPAAAKGPLAATRSAFFNGQPSPGQRLRLSQSAPLPWPQALPTAGPSPHGMEMPSRLPFPAGAPEWQEDSHRALSTAGKTPGPGEKLAAMRSGPDASPALFTYNGLTDPGAQPLFFGVAQPQVSPHGTPSLPPPRVVGASPSESPLPSPATNTAGSTCSSLSPMSSSPANPSSEESQLPGPRGPSAFFHPPTHPQETGSPFPSPEPPHSLPTHYQPEPAKAFPFPADGLGAEGTFQCLEETPFPHEGPEVGQGGLQGFPRAPPLYPAQHFSLSSASLDQLDVLLTCRQCDQNYSSLTAFLAHRQFCGLLLARAKDGHQRPPGPPGLPSPTTAPRVPANAHPGMLNHSKAFLPAEDVQAEGKDDPLRTGFLPSLAATPFPLPASDLDMEDDAKLDSLITEALNGMEYHSDSPEIDSSFIDVFADEEPSGPRGPSTGQPPKTKAEVTPENKVPPPLPAATRDPQAPRPGDRGCPARGRPKTRSLGLAPTEVDKPSQGRQQRRGKQLKLFQKDLDTRAAEGLGGGGRAALRPRRRKGSRGQRPPPCPRDLRTQAPESHVDPTPEVQRAATLPEETRTSPRLRLPPRKDSRRRKARDGAWGKDLILKIVQQKNKHYQRLGRQVGRRGSLAAKRPQPRAEDRRLQEYDYASESEEDQPPPRRGPGFRGRRSRGEKRKEVDLTQGPRKDGEQQKHRKAVRQEAGGDRAPHNPEEPGRPCPDPSRSSEAHGPPQSLEAGVASRERGPKCADDPSLAPKDPLQVPTNTQSPKENHPPLDFPQEGKEPEIVKGSPVDTTELTGVLSSSPASCVEGSPSLLIPEQPQPSRQDMGSPKLSGSLPNMAPHTTVAPHRSAPAPGLGSLLDGPGCTKAPISCNREEPPAHHPAEFLAPMANPSSTACPKPGILSSKISGFGCEPAGFNGDPVGVPVARKGPQPYGSPRSELFLGPKDLAGCFLEDLHPKPPAMDTPPTSSSCLCQDGEDAGPLEPLLPKSLPGVAGTDPGRATSPLTLESTSLFPGLPLGRFDPPLYSSLSADRDPQVPFTCADPPQKQPPSDPPFSSFLLLEEVPPMLPDHFPDPSGGKVLSKTCPPEQTATPGAPVLPGKGSGCSVARMSHLSEDELEIQKLVTELESQLQSSKDTPGPPRELGEPESGGRVEPGTGTEAPSLLPTCQATMPHKDTLSAADLTVTAESTAPQEGAGPAVATMEGIQQRPTATWPCPASFHPGKSAPISCAQEDLVSGSPFSPMGASLHFQLVQKAGVSKTGLHQAEGDSRAPQDVYVCLPEPSKQPGPPLDARSLASPGQELSFPKNKEVTSSQESEDTLRPLPCEKRGWLFPGPGTADGPRPEAPTLEAFSSPAVHLAPDLAFQGDGAPLLDATWPFGARQSHAAQGHSAGRAGGRLYSASGRPGVEGNEFTPAGVSSMSTPRGRGAWFVSEPSPAYVSDTGPSRRSQDPASSPLRQLSILGPGAAESKDGTPALQEPAPAAQSPLQGNPSDLEGGTVKGGKVACGPALGPLEGVEVTTVPAVAGQQLGLEADGQAEKTQVQGRASRLQPVNGGGPGGAGDLSSVNASPKTALARPATGAVLLEKCEGVRAAMSLQGEAPHPPSVPSPDRESLALALTHTQNAPEGCALQRASCLGLNKPLLATGDSPAPSIGDLAACAPSPSPSATPMSCSLRPLPHEDPPTSPSSTTRAQGGLRGQLPASPSCRDPPSPQHPPAYSPAQAPLEEADAIPAHTDTGAGDPPVAPPPLTTSPCDPKGALAHCILQGEGSLLEEPSSRRPGSVSAVAYTHGRGSPEDSTLRIPEDSRKEMLWESPGRATSPPLAGAVSPTMALRAADLSSTLTKDAPQAGRGPPGLEPQSRGTPSHTNPDRMPRGHSYSPSNAALLGHREAHAVTAVPTESPIPMGAGSDFPTCLEGEAGTSSKGPEHPGTSEAGHSGATKVPSVTCPSAGFCLGVTTAPSSTASDFQSDSPKSHRNASHQTSHGDTLHPQDLKQGPRGYKKKPVSTENGQAALGPVTCEVCTASFRSRPGLSRHKARKHRPRPGAPPQPSPAALPAQQPPGPPTQKCQPPRKKSHKAPGKERPSHVTRGLKEVLRTPGSAPSQQQHPPSPAENGVDVKAPASKPRPDQVGEDELHPKQAEKREGRRRHREPMVDSASHSKGKSSKKAGKLRGRRLREGSAPPVSPEESSDGRGPRPAPATASSTAPPSHCLPVEGRPEADKEQPPRWTTPGPRVMEGAAGTDLEALCAVETGTQKLPGDQLLRPGRMDGAALGEQPVGQKGALARGLRRPRETKALGVCKESGSTPADDSSGARSGSEEGVWEELVSPLGALGFPKTSSSPVDSTTSGCLQGLPENPDTQGGVQGPEGPTPKAPGSSAEDPPSLFDDEVSFSQLFPTGGRLTRKRNPRVYGKRCEKPEPQLPTQPSVEEGPTLGPACLPTDLSDSGSLCLCHEAPWEDEDPTGLPESFLLDGLLSNRVPGIDPWAPSLSLWALEPGEEASAEKLPSHCPEDDRPEAIPELHMVPAAWRGLELPVPANDASSSLGDVSPEPPSLERERYDSGLPGNAHLLPLQAADLETLSSEFEMRDLCFLGPFEDPTCLPTTSFLDFEATASSRGPQNGRMEAATGAGRVQGRGRLTKGKRASYKCRVCFQRFRSLGELDLHKMAHTPAPPPTCYMCVERRFGSRELLRGHLQERHAQSKAGPWACGMCLKEVADIWMYNEHLREHAARFARKGQVRRSLGDLPRGLQCGSAIAQLLSGIMEPTPKPHRDKHSVGKASGSPGDSSGPEGEAGKDSRSERAKPRWRSTPSHPDRAVTPDSLCPKALANPGSPAACEKPAPACSSALLPGPAKTTPILSPDSWTGGEPLLQAVPVHEACKDPSRDCHHCGKRFPKPFKLQRHLAVHSPQRVFLCPRCPRVYSEHGELLVHLGGAHGLQEPLELQHTPLYTCELCATVMHIIKKSFACSSCNYTFAKKEQFDRHMDKHPRREQQPFTFHGVRRPGAPGQKSRALEGTLPSKRRRVAMPGSAPGPEEDSPTLSEGSLPALLQPCPEVAPNTTKGWPETLERPADPGTLPIRGCNRPSDHQEGPPPSLSPYPAALAEGRGDCERDRALERPEDEAPASSPGTLLQQALPLGASVPPPGARDQDAEGKRAPLLFSGKRRAPAARGRGAPDHFQQDPALLTKQKQVSSSHMASEGEPGGPFHKGSATKPGGCQSSSMDRSAASTPNKAPKFPVHPRKVVGSLAPGELAHGTENGMKPDTPKAKPGPSPQGSGSPRPGTKTGGGSQPQPASGQLQSETATTPAKPSFPSQSPAPDRLLPRAQAKSCTKGAREAGEQGTHGSPGPNEKGESSMKRKKSQAPGAARTESVGSFGRAPSAPDKPPRTPRKQAAPSRVLPAKPKLNSQNKPRPPPSDQQKAEPGHVHRRDRLGKAFPQRRPPLRPPKRGRAVHGAEPAEPHTHRTAEAQSDLLSQLFGQRLTGFKIPLKKDVSE